MTEFNPKETAEIIFKEMNENHSIATKFLSQERFFNLTPSLAIEIYEEEMPLPAEHLSLAALSRSHFEGPGVVADYDVAQMLLNAGIKRQEAYLRSKKLAEEIYQTLIRWQFIIKIPKSPQDIGPYQLIDPSKEDPPEDPPQNASYKNGPEVYLLENYLYPHTKEDPPDPSRKVTLSKKVNVKLAIPIF